MLNQNDNLDTLLSVTRISLMDLFLLGFTNLETKFKFTMASPLRVYKLGNVHFCSGVSKHAHR